MAQEKNFSGFYKAVKSLAGLDKDQRQRLLHQLAPPEPEIVEHLAPATPFPAG